jgi:hypothetical protein
MDEQRLILVVEDDEATRGFSSTTLRRRRFGSRGPPVRGRGCGGSRSGVPASSRSTLRSRAGAGSTCSIACATPTDWLRGSTRTWPVVVLTGRVGEADRVRSFARGADDYVQSRRVSCFRRCRAAFAAARSLHAGGRVCRPGPPTRELAPFVERVRGGARSPLLGEATPSEEGTFEGGSREWRLRSPLLEVNAARRRERAAPPSGACRHPRRRACEARRERRAR